MTCFSFLWTMLNIEQTHTNTQPKPSSQSQHVISAMWPSPKPTPPPHPSPNPYLSPTKIVGACWLNLHQAQSNSYFRDSWGGRWARDGRRASFFTVAQQHSSGYPHPKQPGVNGQGVTGSETSQTPYYQPCTPAKHWSQLLQLDKCGYLLHTQSLPSQDTTQPELSFTTGFSCWHSLALSGWCTRCH